MADNNDKTAKFPSELFDLDGKDALVSWKTLKKISTKDPSTPIRNRPPTLPPYPKNLEIQKTPKIPIHINTIESEMSRKSDWTLSTTSSDSYNVTMSTLDPETFGPDGDGILIRELAMADYEKGFLELLSSLTIVGNISMGEFIMRDVKIHQNRNHQVWVVEDLFQNEIVGTGTLFVQPTFTHQCGFLGHINEVIVKEGSEYRDLKQRLIQHLIKEAKNRKCNRVRTSVVPQSLKFYKELGFHRGMMEMNLLLDS
jgi:glucosamine-phosphate N-acetyltransferase